MYVHVFLNMCCFSLLRICALYSSCFSSHFISSPLSFPQAFSSLEKLSRDADPYIQQIMTSAAEELSLTTGHLVYMVGGVCRW